MIVEFILCGGTFISLCLLVRLLGIICESQQPPPPPPPPQPVRPCARVTDVYPETSFATLSTAPCTECSIAVIHECAHQPRIIPPWLTTEQLQRARDLYNVYTPHSD